MPHDATALRVNGARCPRPLATGAPIILSRKYTAAMAGKWEEITGVRDERDEAAPVGDCFKADGSAEDELMFFQVRVPYARPCARIQLEHTHTAHRTPHTRCKHTCCKAGRRGGMAARRHGGGAAGRQGRGSAAARE